MSNFIDILESDIEDVVKMLDISKLSELDQIDDAQSMAVEISRSLY